MKITCVVIAYRSEDVLEGCLRSIAANDGPLGRIVVIDNTVGGGLGPIVSSFGGRVELVENAKNIGFAAAVNQGLNISLQDRAQYTLILNADVILEKDALANLLCCAESSPDIGLTGFRVIDGSPPADKAFDEVGEDCAQTPWTIGCGMLIPARTLLAAGYFDEFLFMYNEETDFIWRLRRSGLRLVKANRAVLYHIGEHSSSKRKSVSYYYKTRNIFYFAKKHFHDHGPGKSFDYITSYLSKIFWFPMHPMRFLAYAVGIASGIWIYLFKKPLDYELIHNKDMTSSGFDTKSHVQQQSSLNA